MDRSPCGLPAIGRSEPPWSEQRRLWWLLWSRCPGVGWVRLRNLEIRFGDLETAWSASSADLLGLPGWTPGLIGKRERFRAHWGPDPLPRFRRQAGVGRRVLLPGDRRWPRGIAALDRPPLALHWQGRGSLWALLQRRLAVAVVGTRRPSPHGQVMARRLGAALARAGWPVVSGLAEGIDGAAHEGCLSGGGAPVAVLGTPLGRVYPSHHAVLQSRVGRQGLLISELPAGTRVRPGHFALRNRLQVALASAVVVVECPEGSGALHSAAWAWNEELPLWVVPADAGKRSAAGSNRLLTRGATPLLDPADLIHHLGPGPLRRGPAGGEPSLSAAGLTPLQQGLMAAVGGGASLELLSHALRRPPAALMAPLLDLECSGRLVAEPGLWWRPR